MILIFIVPHCVSWQCAVRSDVSSTNLSYFFELPSFFGIMSFRSVFSLTTFLSRFALGEFWECLLLFNCRDLLILLLLILLTIVLMRNLLLARGTGHFLKPSMPITSDLSRALSDSLNSSSSASLQEILHDYVAVLMREAGFRKGSWTPVRKQKNHLVVIWEFG